MNVWVCVQGQRGAGGEGREKARTCGDGLIAGIRPGQGGTAPGGPRFCRLALHLEMEEGWGDVYGVQIQSGGLYRCYLVWTPPHLCMWEAFLSSFCQMRNEGSGSLSNAPRHGTWQVRAQTQLALPVDPWRFRALG